MEEKHDIHDIVAPVFKTKDTPINKPVFISRPAVTMTLENIQLTVFKGANPSLAAEITKAVVRYAH